MTPAEREELKRDIKVELLTELAESFEIRERHKDVMAQVDEIRRKGEKKAILHCRIEESYLQWLDEWGYRQGLHKRTDALRALMLAEQHR